MVEPISDRLQRLDLSDPKASLAATPGSGTPGTPASGESSASPSEIDTSELNSRSVSGAPTPAPAPADAVPDDELERFRREWKEEVAAKRPGTVDVGPVKWATDEPPAETPQPEAAEPGADKGKTRAAEPTSPKSPVRLVRVVSPVQARSPERRAPVSPKKVTGIGLPARLAGQGLEATPAATPASAKIPFRAPRVRRNPLAAVEVYTQAVEAEQQGRLNDALKLYRHAFKMDDAVDRAYQREARARAEAEADTAAAAEEEGATSADIVDPRGPSEQEYEFTRHIQLEADYARPLAATSRLTALVERFAGAKAMNPAMGEEWEHSRFEEFAPLDPELPLPIAGLPAEILDRIFRHLDVGAVERFGSTCWRARLLTYHSSLWHHLVKSVYRPPMLRDVTVAQLIHRHRGEWRSAFVEEERLRMDGVYISVCHYVRPGAGEEWVAVTHMSESAERCSISQADPQSRTTASSASTPTAPCCRSSRPTTRRTSCRCSSRIYVRRGCTSAAGAWSAWTRTTRTSQWHRRCRQVQPRLLPTAAQAPSSPIAHPKLRTTMRSRRKSGNIQRSSSPSFWSLERTRPSMSSRWNLPSRRHSAAGGTSLTSTTTPA